MAEYIDRDKVLNYQETVITDDYSGNETLEVVLAEEILGLTPADVVEREKIDKAIEKIENYTPCIEDENMRYAFECGMGKALEIIKRNIGESK